MGIKELEGSPRPRCAKAGRHLGPYPGKRNRASYGWLAAKLNCPRAADESRTLRRSECKSLRKGMPRTLAGYMGMNLHTAFSLVPSRELLIFQPD